MNFSIYKTKNLIYKFSKESLKHKRPTYNELIKYQNFKKKKFNKLAISFGAGRSGQSWFSKIFNSHPNWIGSNERFADYEAFYRYVSFYKLPVNKDNFFRLMDLSSKKDMAEYQNSFIATPYLSFGVKEITKVLKPDYIFFNLRNPINTIESLHKKGWYLNYEKKKINSPLIDISDSQYRSFSRIIPKEKFLKEWLLLTRIGKITWFWASINRAIYDDFNKIQRCKKFFIKLEDVNQNYDIYEKLSKRFSFKNKLTKKKFYGIINKAGNMGDYNDYRYKNWSKLEKKESKNIIEKIFPFYDVIKTNI
jgi:hypothetical protein